MGGPDEPCEAGLTCSTRFSSAILRAHLVSDKGAPVDSDWPAVACGAGGSCGLGEFVFVGAGAGDGAEVSTASMSSSLSSCSALDE